MKGLLTKDFRLLLQRKRFFVMIIVIAVLMGFSGQENSQMVTGYLTITVAMIFSISSINYDEFDNCYAFLLTLPVSRRTYVRGKYVFGFLLGLGAWLLSMLIGYAGMLFRRIPLIVGEEFSANLIFLVIGIVLLDVMIPVQLKYGSERGRMAMAALIGGFAVVVYIVRRIMENMGIDLGRIFASMPVKPGKGILAAGGVLALTAATLFSVFISQCIMEKKEF